MRLLVIEDEDRLSSILKSKLGEIGFTVDIAASAGDASAALELINYDAAVLETKYPRRYCCQSRCKALRRTLHH